MANEYDVFDQERLNVYQQNIINNQPNALTKRLVVVLVGLIDRNEAIIKHIFTANPNARLVVDYGDAEVANNTTLPSSVRRISFVGENVTSIGDGFLFGCSGLTSVDLSPFRNVTSIGDGFLSGCNRLKLLDLKALRGLTSIGDSFLSYCISLTSVDLRNVPKPGKSVIHGALQTGGWKGKIVR